MRIFHYLRQLSRMPPRKIALLFEATVWLAVARLALWLVPFQRIGRCVGKLLPPSPHAAAPAEDEMLLARRVGWAVNTVADHLPVNLVCLPRALAGWQMLYRRGIASRLHFGALRKTAERTGLQTHAWLSTPGVEVMGYPVAQGCVELGFFARANGEPSPAVSAQPQAPQSENGRY